MSTLLVALVALGALTPAEAPVVTQAFHELGHTAGSRYRLREADIDAVLRGVAHARAGKPPARWRVTFPEEVDRLGSRRSSAARRDEAGAKLAQSLAKQAGVPVEPSGLVFLSRAEGEGRAPTTDDRVTVYYTAADASLRPFELDHGRNRGQPATFAVRDLVPCWQEALARMKPGARAVIVCPAALAHGDVGRPSTFAGAADVISPGETVLYEIELVSVAPAPASEAGRSSSAPRADASAPLYALGYAFARHHHLTDDDVDAFARGLREGAAGAPREDVDAATREARQKALAQRRARAAKANRAAGKAFAAEAAREKGAETTRSGLVYLSLAEGEGATVTEDRQFKVRIHGRFPDGAELHPAADPQHVYWTSLQHVRPACLQEALPRMKRGGRARVVCPSSLGFGDEGAWGVEGLAPLIPGGATLVYELELLLLAEPR